MLPTRTVFRKPTLFYAICPDYPNVLGERLKVRGEHWRRAEEDKKAGILEFGRGTVAPPDSPLHQQELPTGIQAMNGSIMFFRFQSLEDTWKRIKEDVYYTGGIWDKEKLQIGEFIRLPSDDE
ncbi:uncharacterized protein IL334_003730 [Kwoniella shivajii]|uniref:YCII-related domain-containing protein n=1 Tax=Kwoniella shivajii TaxID=564305 RepID=A0ABZ1CZK6_9TREE|nr:hypothetical protein IL334_003730 [Kwoniella shivajii]